jgi:hypothetical protein
MVISHTRFHLHCIRVSHYLIWLSEIPCQLFTTQKWNGIYFLKTSLQELGLRRQLNHPLGERCLNPIPCAEDGFSVIDISGLHTIAVDFCGCGKDDQ